MKLREVRLFGRARGGKELGGSTSASLGSKSRDAFVGRLVRDRVILSKSDAFSLNTRSVFGLIVGGVKKRLELSLVEALYLVDRGEISVRGGNKILDFDELFEIACNLEHNFGVRYSCFRVLRDVGYTVKTALKYGADFRVYDKGVKPKEEHARWILYCVGESDVLSWREFAAKMRVAHSTKKKLLIGVVDDEGDVTFYEVGWMRA